MARSLFKPGEITGRVPKPIKLNIDTSLKANFVVELDDQQVTKLPRRFKDAINRANQRIITALKGALDNALRANVWPGLDGNTDIYDSGELLESGRVTLDGNGLEISYDAPYASLVHFGGYIIPYGNTSARVYLPARPWVRSVLTGNGPVPKFDFREYYLQELQKEFSR
jgi:hypothetical protein